LAVWSDHRIAVESRLRVGGAPGERIEQEAMWLFDLSFGGLKEAANHVVVFQTLIRAGTLE